MEQLREEEEHADFVIALDRGYDYLREADCLPDLLLGDFDSMEESQNRIPESIEMIRYPAEKDATDTQLGIETAIARGASEIRILGAFGKRQDHFLGNLDALLIALRAGVDARLIDPWNCMYLMQGSRTLKRTSNYVSILPYTDRVEGVTLRGFRYELTDYCMEKGSTLGISNEIPQEEAEVSCRSGILIVVESDDER